MLQRVVIWFVIFLISGGVLWYSNNASNCPVPLAYRLGTLDAHFALSEAEAKTFVMEAEATWEAAAGRDLFVYDEDASFVIDFVFDERQALTDTESLARTKLDERQAEHENLFATIADLEATHAKEAEAYETKTAAYEAKLRQYNETVQQYNDQGGAPEDVFAELQADKRELDEEASDLSATAGTLNELADRINELGEKGNALVTAYNQDVSTYNEQFGYAKEFTQGDYVGDRIHIYSFADKEELATVLVHEFGHALGIDHVAESDAVMYYLLGEDSTPTLTPADVTAFVEVCGEGTELSFILRQKIRLFIQTVM